MSRELKSKNNLNKSIITIDSELQRPGFDAIYLIISGDRAAFVDSGSNKSVPLMMDALKTYGIKAENVDYLFLTHVHLDHAGGAGLLIKTLPNIKAVIHPRGVRHMINPDRLITGSINVYGQELFNKLYGKIIPIPEKRIISAIDGQKFVFGDTMFHGFYTEGHAKHHHCFYDSKTEVVFAGDSFGISFREFDTKNGGFIYPSTTPVHFDPIEAHKAIDKIVGFSPKRVYLTHYGHVNDITSLARQLSDRLDRFLAIALEYKHKKNRTNLIQKEMLEYLLEELHSHGVRQSKSSLKNIIEKDVILNTMGLEFWIENGCK